MHSAPSVTYPVGRFSWLVKIYTIFMLMTSALGLGWALYQPVTGVLWGAGVLFLLSAAAGWRGLSWQGELQWQDENWLLRSGELTQKQGRVEVCLDLQHVLLLRFTPIAGGWMSGKWLWLARQAKASDWQDLRRAVHAHGQQEKKEAL